VVIFGVLLFVEGVGVEGFEGGCGRSDFVASLVPFFQKHHVRHRSLQTASASHSLKNQNEQSCQSSTFISRTFLPTAKLAEEHLIGLLVVGLGVVVVVVVVVEVFVTISMVGDFVVAATSIKNKK